MIKIVATWYKTTKTKQIPVFILYASVYLLASTIGRIAQYDKSIQTANISNGWGIVWPWYWIVDIEKGATDCTIAVGKAKKLNSYKRYFYDQHYCQESFFAHNLIAIGCSEMLCHPTNIKYISKTYLKTLTICFWKVWNLVYISIHVGTTSGKQK